MRKKKSPTEQLKDDLDSLQRLKDSYQDKYELVVRALTGTEPGYTSRIDPITEISSIKSRISDLEATTRCLHGENHRLLGIIRMHLGEKDTFKMAQHQKIDHAMEFYK